jgi:hypothetical protein
MLLLVIVAAILVALRSEDGTTPAICLAVILVAAFLYRLIVERDERNDRLERREDELREALEEKQDRQG